MLTNEQLEAVKQGEHLHLVFPGAEVVVLRADLYERLKASFSNWDEDEMRLIAARTFDDCDTAGPIQ